VSWIPDAPDIDRSIPFRVIPAKAGIHGWMDPGLRRDDKLPVPALLGKLVRHTMSPKDMGSADYADMSRLPG